MTEAKQTPKATLAMVALREPCLPSIDLLQGYLQQHWPAMPAFEDVHETEDGLAFTLGPMNAAIGLVRTPIDWNDLQAPCETAWWWDEATEQMQAHAAHLLVYTTGDEEKTAASMMRLTQLAAAVTATTPAVGVFWGEGAVVTPPSMFQEESHGMDAEALPLMLWINFRLFTTDDGRAGFFTLGMHQLGCPELETPVLDATPDDTFNIAFQVAHHLALNGPVLEEGDTLQVDEGKTLTVRFGPSRFLPDQHVLHLTV